MSATQLFGTDTTAGRAVTGLLTVLVVGGGLGYWFGTSRTGVSEHVGVAYSSETQIAIQTEDWTYGVPLDVRWWDEEGGWHEDGSRPECLPPSGNLPDIRFAALPVETREIGFRQVIAVFCD